MMSKYRDAKCPCCGEDIMIPSERKETFCPCCGKQFLVEAGIVFATARMVSGITSRPKVEVDSPPRSASYPMPHMMTIKQVANTGVLPEAAIRKLIKQNRLPAVYIGSKALINYEKLISFLETTQLEP